MIKRYKIQCFPYKAEKTYRGFIPPSYPEDMPEGAVKILASTYASVRQKWVDEHPDDRENHDNKVYAAQVAWSAVKREYKKIDGKWIKKESSQSFKDKVLLQASLQNFSDSEILNLIQPDVLHDILQNDEHPFFQAYSIAHEGISHSKLLGIGGKIIEWSKDAIKSIGKVIKNGIKCFKGHNKDNSTLGRREIGQIVGHVEKEIDGKLNSIAIVYHPKEVRSEVKDYDVCSQESDWNFEEKDGKLYAVSCEEITAIAFDNSQNNKPAFEGAKRLAMVQCFGEEIKKEVKPMTFEDVKKGKAELNVFASQLYSFDEIKKDREFAKMFEKYEADIKNANEEKSARDKEIERLKGLEKENLKLTQKNRLESILKKDNINLTEEEKLFVFADESINRNSDPTDDGLKNFLQLRRDDYKLYQKINSKDENIDLSNVEKKTTEKIDYTDPKVNDMI